MDSLTDQALIDASELAEGFYSLERVAGHGMIHYSLYFIRENQFVDEPERERIVKGSIDADYILQRLKRDAELRAMKRQEAFRKSTQSDLVDFIQATYCRPSLPKSGSFMVGE